MLISSPENNDIANAYVSPVVALKWKTCQQCTEANFSLPARSLLGCVSQTTTQSHKQNEKRREKCLLFLFILYTYVTSIIP